ncbi:Calcium-binding protein [Actinidia chinensis var. chinensis]|uniref:Calcium-binding protein n=1 Tax=Actinidia chinensis var. chinensis TaxID=1590841 RepID=A0A2R6RN21_ACTCC|nr:Calcium-binding protein [Actinidia chinensis var. chinensis]
MAFTNCYATRGVSSDGKHEMTIDEFKQWLKRFDLNNDGLISKEDLREAVRVNGGWFSGRKSRLGIRSADKNGNGFIEESEINHLVEFAQKYLGVRIIA